MMIREAVMEDIPQIQVVRNAVKENRLSDPALVSDNDCLDFITRRGKGWVSLHNDKVTGFAIADLQENNIWALFVLPEYEGEGLGKRLHFTMMDWYFRQGKNDVWLSTAPATRAEIFYRKQGWIESGIYGKGEIKFSMRGEDWLSKVKDKIILRPWTNEDLSSLLEYANNPLIASNMMDSFPHPYTEEAGRYFINMARKEIPHRLLAIDINGNACGGIGIHPQSDIKRLNAEMGYWLSEQWWGKGIITEAIKKMVVYTFDNFEIDRIFACPFGRNIGSQKALEKAGFVLEGRFNKVYIKNNELVDELVYAIRRNK